jgi:thiamine-monophosphate kinase
LGPGAEFDALRGLLRQWGSVAVGIGDDAAVLDVPTGHRLIVSADNSVEDVHFRRDWLTPEEIGWRATQAAMSDLAAMGAAPLGILVALSVPASWRVDLGALAAGIGEAARALGAPIVGGDVTDSARLSLSITAMGHATTPIRRSGAKVGDTLFVTGVLGGPAAALAAWQAGGTPGEAHRARFARPVARLAAGAWLARSGAHAAIDISDGLAGESSHIAAASNVRCVIDVDRVPCMAGVAPAVALSSGEEYELLVAAAPDDPAAFAVEFARANEGLPLTAVGRVEPTARASGEVVASRNGVEVPLTGAHDHFASQ